MMGDPPGVSRGGLSIKQWKNIGKAILSLKNAGGFSKGLLRTLNKKINIGKQARHLVGASENASKGYLNSIQDAQKVLDAVHSGTAQYLGTTKNGHIVVKCMEVTGTNVNKGAGITQQATNTFLIKGTANPSVVPTSPTYSAFN